MDMTFQEKSIWASLITTIVLFGFYFVVAFQIILDDSVEGIPEKFSIGAIFTGVVIVIVIIEVVVHAILAITYPPEVEDERTHLIGLKATRNGAIILVVGIWLAFSGLAFTTYNPMVIAHLLLSSFILAEIIRFGSQLIYYRRGV